MKKKRFSMSLLSVFGIGIIFGLLTSFMGDVTFTIPFEKEWVIYAFFAALFLLAGRIGILWIRSTKQENLGMDTDEITLDREKLAYQFSGFTSLFLILESCTLLIILLEWDTRGMAFFSLITYSLIIAVVLLVFGIFAQTKAVKFHNKYNPQARINWKKTSGYAEYFEHLDEGQKFEQYRVAYKSFTSMNLAFPAALFILFFVSAVSSPQFIAITVVSTLWFIMYMIYYREGFKIYK